MEHKQVSLPLFGAPVCVADFSDDFSKQEIIRRIDELEDRIQRIRRAQRCYEKEKPNDPYHRGYAQALANVVRELGFVPFGDWIED